MGSRAGGGEGRSRNQMPEARGQMPTGRGRKSEAGGRKPSPAATARCPSGQRAFSVKPDFVFPKLRLAVFVDGCFWHGCPSHATWPKQNAAFWRKKILGNRARDRRVNRELCALGWRVVRVWEHELARNNVFMSRSRPGCWLKVLAQDGCCRDRRCWAHA